MKTSKNPSNDKNIARKQSILIESLEGIGDILVYETRRQKNKLVLEGLQKIADILKRLFEIQKEDPEKFNALILSQEVTQLYMKDKEEADINLAFYPDKHLISFSTAINQITRIYETAVYAHNEEISRFAVYHIHWILESLVMLPDNALFIEQILAKLFAITKTAIQNNDKSAYVAASQWYISIVFDRSNKNGTEFDLSYLPLLDRYFFQSVQYIVSQDKFSIFKALVMSLIVGIHVPTYNRGKVWEYETLLILNEFNEYEKLNERYKLHKRVTELAESENDVDTQEKLNQWFKKLNEFENIIKPILKQLKAEDVKKVEAEIKDYIVSMFKYNNLLEIVFSIGAYCLFKKKPSFIRYLWEYKQPPDSDATWVGHDIVPGSIDEVIKFYLIKNSLDKKHIFWEDRHGSEKYFRQYFLLLLARVLQSIPADAEGKYSSLDRYTLPDLHIHKLNNIQYSMEKFVESTATLRTETNILSELGINIEKVDELFDSKMIPFLLMLKDSALKQISRKHRNESISTTKIEEFKNQVITSFYNKAILRGIFIEYFKTYENRISSNKIKTADNRFGVSMVDDKAAFFDAWHVHYADWGAHYGENMGHSETSNLLNQISSSCTQVTQDKIEIVFEEFEDLKEIVIIASANAGFWFFKDCQNFRPKWQKGISPLEIKGFAGWYNYKDHVIPVFDLGIYGEKQMLIVDRSRIGKLIQLTPLFEGETESLLKDIFYINIRAFSEHSDIKEKFMGEPPEWLKKIGDKEKQEEYLDKRALIEIYERFEYNQLQDTSGYKIILKKEEEIKATD